MNIAVIHKVEAHTTGNYFRKYLALSHKIIYLSDNSELIFTVHNNFSIQRIVNNHHINLLLYIDPVGNYFPIGLEEIDCPTAIYLIDVHRNLEQRLKLAYFFDYVFIAQKDYLQAFKEKGITNVFWLPLACDPETHGYIEQKDIIYDIGFVGNRGLVGSERRKFLDKLEQIYKLNDLTRKYLPEEISTIYSQSKMVFNYAVNGDVNMRVFEALCNGRLLLTNIVPNGLEELFKDRKHLVIYRNLEELIQLSRYYLDHPEEREAIAKAGQAEVLKNHTYQHRVEQVLATILVAGESHLIAPIRSYSAKKRWQAYAQVLVNFRQPLAVLRIINTAWLQGEFTWNLVTLEVKALLRVVNRWLPLTPNALRHRWRTLLSSFSS